MNFLRYIAARLGLPVRCSFCDKRALAAAKVDDNFWFTCEQHKIYLFSVKRSA
jgi:hypothetical protein